MSGSVYKKPKAGTPLATATPQAIRIKRRGSPGASGAPSSLVNAELAFNENDQSLYYGLGGDASAAASVIKIGGAGLAMASDLTAETSARQAADTAETSARTAADTTLQNNIDAETSARQAADTAETSARTAADTTLQNNINAEASTRGAADTAETSARTAADTTLQNNIDAEASTRGAADTAETSARQAADTAETSARTAADTTLQNNIIAETSARQAADTAETSARQAADLLLAPLASPAFTGTPTAPTPAAADNSTQIATTAFVDSAITASSTLPATVPPLMDGPAALVGTSALYARQDHVHPTDTSLQSNIDAEASARSAADTTLQGNIDAEASARSAADTAETSARTAADTTLQNNINAEASTRGAADNALQANIDAETTARTNADNTLQANINAEASTRGAADSNMAGEISTLQTDLATETSNRTAADNTLQAAIDAETTARTNADATLTSNLALKAPLDSPNFTGTPTAPTPLSTNNSTSIATTAFVMSVASSSTPLMDGVAAVGSKTTWASGDHVHPSDTSRLPLTGGTLSGALTLPGAPSGANDAATKAYVDAAVGALGGDFLGTWQVATNTPNISTVPNNKDYYIAVTAVPDVAEACPAGIPGITAGTMINNGDMIVSNGAAYSQVLGSSLTKQEADGLYVALAGSVMTGPLTLSADPTSDPQAATKHYVDAKASAATLTAGVGLNISSNVVSAVAGSGIGVNGGIYVKAGAGIKVNGSVAIDPAWSGQDTLTTLGTVTAGTWNANVVNVAFGGTGASTLTGYLVGNGAAAFTGVAKIPYTDVSGLGTMATENSNAVAITGGTMDSVTLTNCVVDGGVF